MMNSIPHRPSTRACPSRSLCRLLALPALASCVLATSACTEEEPPPRQPTIVTDTRPVGQGLKVIGFAMLGAAVVVVLGRIMTR